MAFGLALLAWGSKSITDPHAPRAFSLSACGGSGAAFVARNRLLIPLFNANELVIVQLDN